MPDLSALEMEALHFEHPVEKFSEVLAQVGGHAVCLKEGECVAEVVKRLYPQAQRTALAVTDMPHTELLPGQVFNPDELDDPAEFNGTDVAIIPAQLGVCENACCWIEQQVCHRALYFIAEALVIVLSKDRLVSNMHEAYGQIPDKPEVPYGVFISGPSKTADIEQALVMGAHGAREVTVILV